MKPYRRGLSVVFLLVFVFIFAAYAQVNTADVTGRITDEQGRVVPGATVTATNTGTGAARTVTTDDGGEYTITQLTPGKYNLSVEAKNFSRLLAQDFELNVGAKVTKNFELKPGEVTATVQVTAEGVAVDTTTSEIGPVLSQRLLAHCP